MRTAICAVAIAALWVGCDRDAKKGPPPTPTAQIKPVAASATAGDKEAKGKLEAHATSGEAPRPQRAKTALPAGHPPIPQNLPPGHPPTGGRPAPGPITGTAPPSAPATGSRVSVMGFTIDAPKARVREPPMSQMRLAQFRLPKAEGDPRDGVCTVIVAGGDVPSNIKRWRGQFKDNPPAATDSFDVGGIAVSTATIKGTFNEQARPMAGGPGTPRSDTTMHAIIATIGQRKLFIKAWGPSPTMRSYSDEMVAMAKSLKRAP